MRANPFLFLRQSKLLLAQRDALHQEGHVPGQRPHDLKALAVLPDLAGGAAVGVGPNMNAAMTEELFRLAREMDIPCQTEVCPGGNSGTDAAAVQVSRVGVATALLSLPLKYMHTPVETVLLEDMESVRRLIVEYVRSGEV